jgi:hypothetical protein
MPRHASRLLLEVTDVAVERVQEIDPVGVLDEGIMATGREFWPPFERQVWEGWEAAGKRGKPPLGPQPLVRFIRLWDSINAARGYGWDSNPWVWVVSFRVLRVGQMAEGGEA